MQGCKKVTNFSQIYGGYRHSLAITDEGEVYSWGDYRGCGTDSNVKVPTKMKWFKDNNKIVLKASCGYLTSAFIVRDKKSQKKDLYCLGYGPYG